MPAILRLAALAALLATPALAEPEVHDARLFMAREGAPAAAAYMVIHNHGGEPDRLLSASSPAASSVMLHGSEEGEDGVVRMTSVEGGLDLPTDGTIDLAPGGFHVMLMGLDGRPADGGTVPLTLEFESGPLVIDLPVEVQGQGDTGAMMEHGDHGMDAAGD